MAIGTLLLLALKGLPGRVAAPGRRGTAGAPSMKRPMK